MAYISLVNLFIAFFAGFVTFFAGCLIPIVPVYVSFLAGASVGRDRIDRFDYLINALLFTLGFAIVFIFIGAGLSSITHTLAIHQRSLEIFGGVVLIVMGILLLDIFSVPIKQINFFEFVKDKRGSRFGSLLLGLFFALSWSPCIGPVLASILFWVSISASFWPGMLLLFVFTLGLSLPFILIGLAFETLFPRIRRLQDKLVWMHKIAALALIIFGVLLLTGSFSKLSGYFLARVGTLAPTIQFK